MQQGLARIEREMCINVAQFVFVTDRVTINEQNKAIVTGPLYLHSEIEAIWPILPEDVMVLNPMGRGYRTSYHRHEDAKLYFLIEKWCGMKWESGSVNGTEVLATHAQGIFIYL